MLLARCKGVTVECMGDCSCTYPVTTSDPCLGYQNIANSSSCFKFTSDGKFGLKCPDRSPVCGVDQRV